MAVFLVKGAAGALLYCAETRGGGGITEGWMLGRAIRMVRRNHALEHGTVTIMLDKLGPSTRLAGRAVTDGFYIYGKIPTDVIASSADEALRRFHAGEAGLAVTPLCGTNIAVAGMLTGAAALAAMGDGRRESRSSRLPTVCVAAMLAVVAAQPLGALVQKYITTSPDQDGARIDGVQRRAGGWVHKVRTIRAAETPS
jgi:hypothetical protein